MPTDYIKTIAKEQHKSINSLEKIWNIAKEKAKKEDKEDNYAYITQIFKNMAGITESIANTYAYLHNVNKTTLIESIIKAYENPPISYTIDIAVLENNENTIIELNDFFCFIEEANSKIYPCTYFDTVNKRFYISSNWLVGLRYSEIFTGKTEEEAFSKLIDYLYNNISADTIVGSRIRASGFPDFEKIRAYFNVTNKFVNENI